MAPTIVELVEVIVWLGANSDGLPSACASLATVCRAVWMLVSCLLSVVIPVCWFCRLVTCCCWAAISAWTTALVFRPEARPVICSALPDPSELSELPLAY